MRFVPWLTVLLGVLVGCGAAPLAPTPTPTHTQPRRVTITGLDPVTNTDISPVNVWDDYRTRVQVVGRVSTGDTVTLLQEVGEGCQILLANGTVGWVSRGFIQELR